MLNSTLDKEALDKIIKDNGYLNPKFFEDGRAAVLMPLLFTCAIVDDLDSCGYGDRWCYHTVEDAKKALAAWDGAEGTEPDGWHRHPASGRRRENGKEWVNF
jgi:hypothetical protein